MPDLYKAIPKTLKENLAYRQIVLKRCAVDKTFRRAMLSASKADVLLWLNLFVWLYEPRPRFASDGRLLPKIIPCITWPHQDPVILEIDKNLGLNDIGVEKARGEGMSWLALMLALRDWLFEPGAKIGLVSNTEKKADDPGNMDSLLAKCLAVDTKVLCSSGWKPLSEIQEGDYVIGSAGKPVKVLRVVEPYEADLYRIRFSDNSEVTCTGDHQFPVTMKYQRQSARRLYNPHKHSLVTVDEMRRNVRADDGKHWNYQVQSLDDAVEFSAFKLPMDPYSLGALIGDGCLTKTSVELAGIDHEIIDLVSKRLGPKTEVRKWSGISWGICGGQRGEVSTALRGLGLRGKHSWEKFIPKQYQIASREDRLELLRGLMDTDGNSSQKGLATLTTTSKVLAENVSDLVSSLGGHATTTSVIPSYEYKGEKKSGRRAYRVLVSLPKDNPFHLSRKRDLYRHRKHSTGRMVVSIEPCGRGPVSCVTVDSPDSLFVVGNFILTHNCDWELEKLPKWMAGTRDVDYKRNLADHSLVNKRNFSQINAFAATGDAGRAGRYKWFLCDELAFWDRGIDSQFMTSIRGSTESRLVISTPNGSDGEYYSFMHTPSNAIRLVLDWKDNPTRNRGLYEYVDGKPVAVDPVNNPLPKHYDPADQTILDLFSRLVRKGFKLDKRMRSPWYDRECDRSDSTPQSIAQELDRDYGGSTYRVFGTEFTEEAKKGVRPPAKQGDLSYHPETLEPKFETHDSGPLLIWTQLDHRGRPPRKQYAIGCDVSTGLAGSYTSNSVAEVIDISTMEQVAEISTNSTSPADFADLCIALAKWFYNAYLAWEINGPGAGFGKRVLDKGYGDVYYRTQHWKRGKGKKTREVGWWTDAKSKEMMFGELLRSVRCGEVKLKSKMLVEECGQYVRINGKIEHVLAVNTADDSSRGQAHGDRVIAMGVCLQAVRDRPPGESKTEEDQSKNPPPFTMAARQKEYEQAQKDREGDGWDDRTNDELAGGDMFAGRFRDVRSAA